MTYLYRTYQLLIAAPLLVLFTLITALNTEIFFWAKNSAYCHWVQQMWSRSFFWLLGLPVTVKGLENIEKGKSYVFVANHQSALDVWLVYGYLPVVYKWLMKKELRYVPLIGNACAAAGHIFVDRKNPRAAYRAMQRLKDELREGVSTVIFPEGTRSKTGEMGRFKRGAFQIALDLGLDIIPLSISGAYDVQRPGQYFARRHPVCLTVGKPIRMDFDRSGEVAEVRAAEEAFIERVHQAVAENI